MSEDGDTGMGAPCAWPRHVRARCSGFGIGELQGEVKGDASKLVARCGSRRRALRRARTEQGLRHSAERAECMPDAMYPRGHPCTGATQCARGSRPCLGSSPFNTMSVHGLGSSPDQSDKTRESWQVSVQKLLGNLVRTL